MPAGVTVYIIDSGIDCAHPEFQGARRCSANRLLYMGSSQ